MPPMTLAATVPARCYVRRTACRSALACDQVSWFGWYVPIARCGTR